MVMSQVQISNMSVKEGSESHANPKVSVIIPVYNSAPHLPACLDSVVNQTLKEIEIILVYDKSSDNSLDILYEYQKHYPKIITILLPEEKAGPGGARNLGMKYARAKYIGFVDSDDIAERQMFEKMYQKAIETGADMVWIPVARFSKSPSELQNPKPFVTWDDELLSLDNRDLTDDDIGHLIKNAEVGFYSRLIRRDIIVKNNLYFPERIRWEDHYLLPLLMPYLKRMTFITEILYYYRNNPTSIVNTVDEKSIEERIQSEEMMLDEMKRRGVLPKYSESVGYIALTRYLSTTSWLIMSSKFEDKHSKIREIRNRVRMEFPNAGRNRYVAKYCSIKQKIFIGLLLRNMGVICCMMVAVYLKCKRTVVK